MIRSHILITALCSTSTSFLPHLVVIGGSYVGLEFAQVFRRFGSEVTIVEMGPRLIRTPKTKMFPAAIKGIMENEGIQLRLNAKSASAFRNRVPGP